MENSVFFFCLLQTTTFNLKSLYFTQEKKIVHKTDTNSYKTKLQFLYEKNITLN